MTSLVARLNCRINSVPQHAMPPIAEYEAWLKTHEAGAGRQGRAHLSASKYRRIAQLRRMQDTWAEIARCVGMSPVGEGCKKAWLRLPEELR